MTPLRIRLAGFLSYREPQELRFDDGGVWLLSGANGSGKSAIFDALTFALFNSHRGGAATTAELINSECQSAQIELDFAIGAEEYRASKAIKRTRQGSASATQQLSQRLGNGWSPIPDTTRKVDFEKWMTQHLGLTYETFTSSVLLLQNKAEKLLDAKPASRAEVLAGIVDLDRVKRLHERANERRLTWKAENDAAVRDREALPEVTEEQLTAARDRVAAMKKARTDSSLEIDSLLKAESEARAWAEASVRSAASLERLRKSEATLRDAVTIESRHVRYSELKAVLPSIRSLVSERARIHESETKTARLKNEHAEFCKLRDQQVHRAESSKAKREELKKQLAVDDAALQMANQDLLKLAGLEKIALELEEEESRRIQIANELSRIPSDAPAIRKQAEAEFERLRSLRALLPLIRKHANDVVRLQDIERKIQERTDQVESLKREGEAAKVESERANKAMDDGRARQAKAEAETNSARSQVDRARELLESLESQTGGAACRACGQPLTAGHLAAEREKRAIELARAELAWKNSTERQQKTREDGLAIAEEAARRSAQLEELRQRYRDAVLETRSATTERERLGKEIRQSTETLPEAYRQGDFAAIEAWDGELKSWDDSKHRLDEATTAVEQSVRWNEQLKTVQASIAKRKSELANVDPLALRAQHHERKATQKSLSQSIRGLKHEIETAEREIDVLGRSAHEAAIRLTDLAGKLTQEEKIREIARGQIARCLATLSDPWRSESDTAGMEQVARLEQERDELAASGIEMAYRELGVVRAGLEAMRLEAERLQREADAFPPDARRDPEAIRRELSVARLAAQHRERDVHTAERELADLVRQQTARSEITNRVDRTAREFAIARRLTDWLGRDYLQRYLVRTAERQILDHANNVLDRLSAGSLFLSLVTGQSDGDDTAFDLLCTNQQTRTTVPVAFLSGGQRFRVAMSIALGIGQYAGKQHRPIESVIIDEGFGSLDRGGRQTVIQELQNLRGLLRCVILVSHQEEFADAFPQGYRIALHEGATVVQRL
jgi:DNA repair exonuclease SbcCD ATPase subunit